MRNRIDQPFTSDLFPSAELCGTDYPCGRTVALTLLSVRITSQEASWLASFTCNMFCSWLMEPSSSHGQVQSSLFSLSVATTFIRGKDFLVILGGGYLDSFRISYLENQNEKWKEAGDAESPDSFYFAFLMCSYEPESSSGQSLESLNSPLRDGKFLSWCRFSPVTGRWQTWLVKHHPLSQGAYMDSQNPLNMSLR